MISCTPVSSPVDSSTRWHGKPECHGCIRVRQVRQLFCRLRKGQIAVQHCLHMPAYAITRAYGLYKLQLQYRCQEAAPQCQIHATQVHARKTAASVKPLLNDLASSKADMRPAWSRALQQQGLERCSMLITWTSAAPHRNRHLPQTGRTRHQRNLSLLSATVQRPPYLPLMPLTAKAFRCLSRSLEH